MACAICIRRPNPARAKKEKIKIDSANQLQVTGVEKLNSKNSGMENFKRIFSFRSCDP